MSRNSVAHLFKEPAQWPLIPPWWLVSAPQAAALLNIKPATLQSWRIRGGGPEPVPPMYLHPTQGSRPQARVDLRRRLTCEVEIGSHDDRGALVEATDEVEQQLAAGLRERKVAKLVKD